jgi:hypothetical protein
VFVVTIAECPQAILGEITCGAGGPGRQRSIRRAGALPRGRPEQQPTRHEEYDDHHSMLPPVEAEEKTTGSVFPTRLCRILPRIETSSYASPERPTAPGRGTSPGVEVLQSVRHHTGNRPLLPDILQYRVCKTEAASTVGMPVTRHPPCR